MDYKQHKGNLRGQIKSKVERKLYNKRIRSGAKNDTAPDVSLSVCICENPKIETCLLSGVKFCMNCICPIKN